MADKISLTIDGTSVEVNEGVTVLEAAQQAGIYIPTLCYHPSLKPYGGCRLCVVEIEGMRGQPTSCTTPAARGMTVTTNSESLRDLRRAVMELILTEHPNDCLTCHRRHRCSPDDICLRRVGVTERCVTCVKNQRCELQQLVDYLGMTGMTLPYHYKDLPVDTSREPLVRRDYNLCVLCGRCVNMCTEARGIEAVNFHDRGFNTGVGTAYDVPLQDGGCRFCGACVEVCPVGALMDVGSEFQPQVEDEKLSVSCKYACPADINVPMYVWLAGEGRYQESLAIVREKVPFPGTLGRVCIHPCEQACRRNALNDPISIRFLKRFVADRDDGEWKKYSRHLPSTGKKVAIVGSGPSGLTAGYYLAKAGHGVTVFEQFSKSGGMMRLGIPSYRLPDEILDGEIDEILSAGIELKLNTRIEDVDKLLQEGYDAVFLAPGAHQGMSLGVEGDNLPSVFDGASFLRDANLGNKVNVGDKVAVIGGGNVAIDSARVALRLGAKEVHIIYRRTRAEMPAAEEEVEAALEEGIILDFLTSHLKVEQKNGHLALQCNRNALGEPDASGRRRPVPIKGSEFELELDTIIGAIGQRPDIPKGFGVETARGNTIKYHAASGATSKAGVWAGGDAASGPDSVIRAIAAGRVAAQSIDAYLGGSGNIEEELTTVRQLDTCVGLTAGDFTTQPRVKMPCLPLDQVKDNFIEVETGFPEEDAIFEGKRCFGCGFRLAIPPAPRPPVGKNVTYLK